MTSTCFVWGIKLVMMFYIKKSLYCRWRKLNWCCLKKKRDVAGTKRVSSRSDESCWSWGLRISRTLSLSSRLVSDWPPKLPICISSVCIRKLLCLSHTTTLYPREMRLWWPGQDQMLFSIVRRKDGQMYGVAQGKIKLTMVQFGCCWAVEKETTLSGSQLRFDLDI